MDLGEFTASNVVGPMRLNAANRDVRIQEFSEALDLETDRGDIELTPGKLPLPKIEARSRSGRIELALPAKSSFQLRHRPATAKRSTSSARPFRRRPRAGRLR